MLSQHPLCKVKYSLLSHFQLFVTPWTVSLPGSFVHRIFQASILERVAISFSRGSSRPRDQTCVSCIGRQIFNHCTHLWNQGVQSLHLLLTFLIDNPTLPARCQLIFKLCFLSSAVNICSMIFKKAKNPLLCFPDFLHNPYFRTCILE